MAARGPKPKETSLRRQRNKPTHEWTEVLDVPFVGAPSLPRARSTGETWPASTRRWYAAVSTMPHCKLWAPSDWMFVVHTAHLVAAFDGGNTRLAAEIRQREKTLGVTVDDRRDLRIRYVEVVENELSAGVTSLDDYRDL